MVANEFFMIYARLRLLVFLLALIAIGVVTMDKCTGVVKWFNAAKGFGFISCDKKDYFVHFKAIQSDGYKELHEGQKVSFAGRTGDKGLVAEDVAVIV